MPVSLSMPERSNSSHYSPLYHAGRYFLKLRLTLLSSIPVLSAYVLLVIICMIISYGRNIPMYRDEGLALAESYASLTDRMITILGRQSDVADKDPRIVNESLSTEERKAILKPWIYPFRNRIFMRSCTDRQPRRPVCCNGFSEAARYKQCFHGSNDNGSCCVLS